MAATSPSGASLKPEKRVATGSSSRQAARRKQVFLAELTRHGNVTEACRTIKVGRTMPYEWSAKDPVFKAAMEQAQEASIDALELEARRRAEEGVEEPVYQGGRLVGTKRVYSDRLIEFLLGGLRPEKYRPANAAFARGEIGQVTFTLDFGFAKTPALTEQGPPALESGVTEASASADDLEAGAPARSAAAAPQS